ncbi:cytidylyltransferase domain-containing protein [Herbaspirillum sp. NPDC101396]|uniref:acylneuraminate cytidylyltransferase family protein n=1 Tax=Herbaspirillum sp. NPDC101396 TaxID=3364005 RepID=UPI00383B990C
MRFVGLITARGGSKGLPGKNTALAGGKPLINWSIEAAQKSLLERTIISTDSEDIAAICRAAGGEVPFMRPAELAQDDTPHIDVILHALDWLESNGDLPEYIVLLQPTSPMRQATDIDGAVRMAVDNDADSVISVFPAPVHPFWIRRLDASGRLEDFMKWPEQSGYLRRQVLPPAYALNGAIYVLRSRTLRENRNYFTDKTFGYVMSEENSTDIDTHADLLVADLLLKQRKE